MSLGLGCRFEISGFTWRPCDLVTTSNWAYNSTYNLPKWACRATPVFSRVITPVKSSY